MINVQLLTEKVENAADIDQAKQAEFLKTLAEATYYGRNEKLLKVEKILDKMVELGHQPGKTTSREFAKLTNSVADQLCSIFGFSRVVINGSFLAYLHPELFLSLTTTSGCTLCHTSIFKYTMQTIGGVKTQVIDLDKNHKGVQFKSGAFYTMTMFLSPKLFMPNGQYSMTGGEILAIMLHEIGHNFYIGPVHEIGKELLGMLDAADLMKWFVTYLSSMLVLEGAAAITNVEMNDTMEDFIQLYSTSGTVMNPVGGAIKFYKILKNLKDFAEIITRVVVGIPVGFVKAVLGYDAEKYSDAFATSFGYGAELSSALDKLNHSVFIQSSHTGISELQEWLLHLYRIPFGLIAVLTDEHPQTEGRLINDIKYMEAAGASIEDPKVRAEYNAQLKRMYALKDQVKSYRGLNPSSLNAKFHMTLADFTGISDWKELISVLRPGKTSYWNLDFKKK